MPDTLGDTKLEKRSLQKKKEEEHRQHMGCTHSHICWATDVPIAHLKEQTVHVFTPWQSRVLTRASTEVGHGSGNRGGMTTVAKEARISK